MFLCHTHFYGRFSTDRQNIIGKRYDFGYQPIEEYAAWYTSYLVKKHQYIEISFLLYIPIYFCVPASQLLNYYTLGKLAHLSHAMKNQRHCNHRIFFSTFCTIFLVRFVQFVWDVPFRVRAALIPVPVWKCIFVTHKKKYLSSNLQIFSHLFFPFFH